MRSRSRMAVCVAALAGFAAGCSAFEDNPFYNTVSERSYQSATKELQERAEGGDTAAQYQLGFINAYGEGVPVNSRRAVDWFAKAAEQGHLQAQVQLATLYRDSRSGVLQDLPEAARWFNEAALHGHVRAQYELGRMYQNGLGVRQDDATAVQWFQAAAYENHAQAQFLLARAFVDAAGVRLDPSLAYVWARISQANGVAEAGRLLQTIETMLRPAELESAESMAMQWLGQ